MSRAFCLLSLLVFGLLTACSNGDNSGNSITDVKPFTPDFSTPGGATEAYARAIEDQNEELMTEVMVEAEREAKLAQQLHNIRESKKNGLDWRLDFESGSYIGDNMVVTNVTFNQIKGGVTTPMQEFPVVFVKVTDGTWRFSPVATREYQDAQEKANEPEDSENNEPEDPPAEDGENPSSEE